MQHSPDLTRAARASQASWRSPPMGARLPESIGSDAGVGMCAAALGGADAVAATGADGLDGAANGPAVAQSLMQPLVHPLAQPLAQQAAASIARAAAVWRSAAAAAAVWRAAAAAVWRAAAAAAAVWRAAV